MFQLKIDKKNNLFEIKLSSIYSEEEAKQCLELSYDYIAQLEPDFRILTDLTDVEKIEKKAVPFIAMLMDKFNEGGVSMIVRIIPDEDKDIGFNIMSLFHYDSDVKIFTCKTREQALSYLRMKRS